VCVCACVRVRVRARARARAVVCDAVCVRARSGQWTGHGGLLQASVLVQKFIAAESAPSLPSLPL
jgi:hypothetical protein